jgi:hypothetical protein
MRAPFGCADKSAEKYCWLICCERKNTVPAEKISRKVRIISRMNKTQQAHSDLATIMQEMSTTEGDKGSCFMVSHIVLGGTADHAK